MIIKIVGIGGITNQLLPTLIQKYPPAKLILYDGDIYEDGNLDRQPFCQTGGNKAIVTARALGEMGIKAEGIPIFISPDTTYLLSEGDIILAGLDNFPSRRLLNDRCMQLKNVLLISGGNELIDGSAQVLWRQNGVCITPPLTYCHPEIEHPKGKAPYERGCMVRWRSEPQLAETNRAVGLAMLEALADTLADKPVAEIYVSTEPTFTRRKVTPKERGWENHG
jgi:molybdopterin/thiamine biosynthesis adenylyltransferase